MDAPILYWIFLAMAIVAPVVAILAHWKGFWAAAKETFLWGMGNSQVKWWTFVFVFMAFGFLGMLAVALSQLPAD